MKNRIRYVIEILVIWSCIALAIAFMYLSGIADTLDSRENYFSKQTKQHFQEIIGAYDRISSLESENEDLRKKLESMRIMLESLSVKTCFEDSLFCNQVDCGKQ